MLMHSEKTHRLSPAGRLARAAALAAGAALVAPPASAQTAPPNAGPTELATARALGIEGVKLADANNCAEAVPKLDRSERIHHAPTTLGRLGECHVQLGALVLGTELLQRVVREPLPTNGPQVFVVAKARAQKVLDQALPKIGKLRISVKAPTDVRPTVAIDGEPVSSALLEVDRPTDPGSHRVEASAPGFRPASATVTLREGGSESVALTLEPDPNAQRVEPLGPAVTAAENPIAPPGSATTMPPPAAAPERSSTSRVLAYGALGVGAAGLVAGSVLGALAISKASDLEGKCPNKQCATLESQDDLKSASRMGTWSTVAFGVGAVGLVGGVVLLLTSSPGPAASAATSPGFVVRPRVGFGSLGLEGSF